MTRIRIDGVPCETFGDETLLEVLRRLGHEVPTLCNDERLAPQPVCRMCVVEVSGIPHPVPACATRPEEGMEVRTRSPGIDAHRRMTLELLAHRHPPEALHDPLEHDFAATFASTGSRTRCTAGPIRSSSTTRIPTSTSTCRAASTATAASASATTSRASPSGRCGTAATR